MQKSMKKHAQHGFSQFEITQEIVTNLKQFDVTPTAKLVLVYLSTCYNPKKADMFPKQKTIADRIGVSERSVVRAIQELIKAGLILVESKYSNHYIFTSKIARECPQNEKKFYSEKMSEDLCKNDTSIRDNLSQHVHEQIREPKKEQTNVVSLKKVSSIVQAPKVNERKTVKLDEIPDIIKNNPKVDNKCAYWASLDDEAKQSYIERQKEEEKKAALKAENAKKAEEERKHKEEEERQYQAECHKPLTEQYTYEEACNLIKTFANVNPRMAHTGIAKRLAEAFKIDIEKLL